MGNLIDPLHGTPSNLDGYLRVLRRTTLRANPYSGNPQLAKAWRALALATADWIDVWRVHGDYERGRGLLAGFASSFPRFPHRPSAADLAELAEWPTTPEPERPSEGGATP